MLSKKIRVCKNLTFVPRNSSIAFLVTDSSTRSFYKGLELCNIEDDTQFVSTYSFHKSSNLINVCVLRNQQVFITRDWRILI